MTIFNYPKVSAFVVTFQQRDFIEQAIDSILSQKYPNIEIIIGDDGSTDGTQDILREYRENHPDKIKIILSEKNTGITENCNRVFKACTGKYIAFLAGDDIWLQGKIMAQVEYMEKHQECSICYHNFEVFDSISGDTLHLFNGPLNPPREGGADVVIKYGCFSGAPSIMVRISDCPQKGFDPRIPIASDWLFWVESLLRGGQINYLDKIFSRYRIHNNNVSKPTNDRIYNNFIDHLNSANIIILENPQYAEEILYRIKKIYEVMSVIDLNNKNIFKTISKKFTFNIFDKLYLSWNRHNLL